MEFSELIRSRRSIKDYDPTATISDAELAAIFEDVILSPSSFNLQHWRFIAVRDSERKKALRAAAWGQEQVENCAVAIVICGLRDAHEHAPEIYAQTPAAVREALVPMIAQFYGGKEELKRDEAVRSGSLAAMTLMYAARDHGWDTGPMIGFDPAAVAAIAELPPDGVPVMLVVLGKAKGEPRPRPMRYPVERVVHLERFNGPGLGA